MIAVRKETLKSMQRQLVVWADSLHKPSSGNHEDAMVQLAGRLSDAATALQDVISHWPAEYGVVVHADSKPLNPKGKP